MEVAPEVANELTACVYVLQALMVIHEHGWIHLVSP